MATTGDHGPASNSASFSLDEANRILNLVSNLLICNACGTQYIEDDRTKLPSCFICDDPRQYVPPSGQSFTTLSSLQDSNHVNQLEVLSFPTPSTSPEEPQTNASDDRFYTISTTPKFAIGQRAFLIRTPTGNLLWDCITYLDLNSISTIQSLGGLAAIVISHPHFYSSHLLWAAIFKCPVYLSTEDREWLVAIPGPSERSSDALSEITTLFTRVSTRDRKFLDRGEAEIEINAVPSGVRAIKLGGHFPGSLVLQAHSRLLIADTLMTTPAGLGNWSGRPISNPQNAPRPRPDGMNSFSFMWSIPNMIPLSIEEMHRMWHTLREYDFVSTHGGFAGMDVTDGMGGSEHSVKQRILESIMVQKMAMEGVGVRVTRGRVDQV